MIPVTAFDFDLPESLIAQEPRPRGASRLLVVDRAGGRWHESTIGALPSLLSPGDVMVANDTRVFPARLLGRRDPSGGAAECFLLERIDDHEWHGLVHPGQKLKPGARLIFEDAERAPGVTLTAEVLAQRFFGRRSLRFEVRGRATVDDAIDALGHVPLPPYIKRADRDDDRERYQTVYARVKGSVAAPTAGLHFNDHLVEQIRAAGIGWQTVTLHVGYGTFKPVRVEQVEEHKVDAERFSISVDAVESMCSARASGHRVVAVGTTTTRALETAAAETGEVRAGAGATELFMYPGHRFRAIDGLLTNFHLPKSSLLMLVAAFAGVDLTMAAYRDAVARGFHFYSYGDAMLIL